MTIGHALQALLPGTALPYYGDEIAMIDGPVSLLLILDCFLHIVRQ